jgi:hypothetical protein
MGQTIVINESTVLDGVLLLSTDRSLTGQDGEAFTGPVSAAAAAGIPARLAVRLFESDREIDHIYVLFNTLSIRRRGEWTAEAIAAAEDTVARFFRFYQD